mgnify:CR=1 FL=1
MQQDVVDIVAGWLHGGPEAAGFMTTGGTESILLAVKAARERGRAEREVERPNVVLPASAHAASREGRALLRPGEPAHPGAGRLAGGRRGDGRRRSTTAPCSWSSPRRSTRRA